MRSVVEKEMRWCGRNVAVVSKTACMLYDPVIQGHIIRSAPKSRYPWSRVADDFKTYNKENV